jgi:hypothetical protein
MSIDRVHILRWGKVVVPADVAPIVEEMQKLHQKVGPVIGIALMPPQIAPPDDEMRKVIGQNLRPIMNCSESLHYVIEGTGFKSSIIRSVITNVLMLAGQRRRIGVYSTLDEALRTIEPRLAELGISVNQIIAQVKARGMYELRDPAPERASMSAPL